jgi:hypothetical protein
MRTLDSTLRWKAVSDYVTVTVASAQTAAISSNVFEVRVVSTTNCHINIGANPTAAATDNNGIYLPANVVEFYHVSPGQKIAVIRDTADGVFCMAEMTR